MFRIIYTIIFVLALPAAILHLFIKGKANTGYRKRWREHFGLIDYSSDKPAIWIHSVSVGETLAAIPIIHQLLAKYPQYQIVVTTTTVTAAERVEALLGERVVHLYAPYDLPWVIRKFVKKLQPKLVMIMETELWPNFIYFCRKRNIPLVLVNARLSARSAGSYARLPIPTKKLLLDPVTHFACQSKADARRLMKLGADKSSVTVTGSIKFDLQLPENLKGFSEEIFGEWSKTGFVWVAASTHAGEDELVLAVHRQLLEKGLEVKLILVPRHPERFDSVGELIVQRGFSCQKRSSGKDVAPDTQVFLCDTMGELMYCYQVSDLALVGGSFIERGGHNPLEPAALGKAVISGVHVFNFADVYKNMCDSGAAKLIKEEALLVTVEQLIEQPGQRKKMGLAGLKVVEGNRGALARTMRILEPYL